MIIIYFLLVLARASQVASLDGVQHPIPNNLIESNALRQFLNERQEKLHIDPNQRSESEKSILSDIAIGLIIYELVKTSNFPTLVATNISEKCHSDSQAYYDANLLLVNWANQMFESTGKLPDGLFSSGNKHANGLYDECINVQANWTSTTFQGKYCTVFLENALVMPDELAETEQEPEQRSNWLTIYEAMMWLYNGPTLKQPKVRDTNLNSKYLASIDFCIPSSCSMEEFRYAVAQLIGSRAIGNTTHEGNFYYTSMVAVTDENYCYTKEKINATPDFDRADIAVIVLLSVLSFAIVSATSHEIWLIINGRQTQTNKDGLSLRILHCFSVITNGRKLLSTKSLAVDNLACLNGIRVLSTTWIVLFHTYYQASINPMSDGFLFNKDALTWQVHGIQNATVAVDTFLVISALLVTYSLLRELDRNKGRFNIGLFYLHRYLRLTAVYAFILSFIATLLVYLGSGPYWQNVRDSSLACRWNWWNNLLYINNYVMTYPDRCMGETWYLACEMQMFLVSPLFIYPLWKNWKLGLSWAVFSILSLLAGTIAIFIVWDLPPSGGFTRNEKFTNPYYYSGYYSQMWTRFPPYILGILIGWVLHHTKKTKIEMNKCVVTTGWVLAAILILTVSYGLVPYGDPVEVPEINDFVRVSYGSLHRFIWAASIAWIIFACISGYGGFVNHFLSWKLFTPLSKLTYVVYLIHFNYLMVFHAFARKPYYYIKFNHTEHIFGTILMVFLMAFAICLTVEVPLLNLERVLLPSRSKKPKVVDNQVGISRVDAKNTKIDVP